MKWMLAVIICILPILYGCYATSHQTIAIDYEYDISSDFNVLIPKAKAIVVGQYTDVNHTWNMNASASSEEEYTEGIVYHFDVEDVLVGEKGMIHTSIEVSHRHFERMSVELDNGKTEVIDVEDPLFIEPKMNKKYVLFLQENASKGHYFPASEPFRFHINESVLTAESRLFQQREHEQTFKNVTVTVSSYEGVEDLFSGRTLEEINKSILQKE